MKVKTALGKTLDMGALISRNEKSRAVGNMKVNARGDTIDSHGKVIQPVNDKVANKYGKTVGNRSANVVQRNINKEKRPTPAKVIPPEIKEDKELVDIFNEYNQEDIEIEQVKKQRGKNDY